MSRLIRTILVAGLLAASACAAGTTPTPIAPASRERSVEVAGVTVAATPERIDTTGAVVRTTVAVFRCVAALPLSVMCGRRDVVTLRYLLSWSGVATRVRLRL